MKNNCLQAFPSQGFSVINDNGRGPPTQSTKPTVEIYSSMSKEWLISVLLNSGAGGADKARRPPALPPPHHGKMRIYGTLPRPPPGTAAIFDVAGSPGARARPLTTDEDERAATPVPSPTRFKHLPPGRKRQKALIEIIDLE